VNRQSLIVTGVVLLPTPGCGIGHSAEPGSRPRTTPIGPPEDSGLGFAWPKSLPDDIPILKGDIQMVMEAPGSHIRVSCQNPTERQLEQYLDQLEKDGFHLEYMFYTKEGYPDKSEEKQKRGDCDAVDITKGEYHMRIEYGKDTTAYDIYTSGFEDGTQYGRITPNHGANQRARFGSRMAS
jgi:hypothetical protein